ncbi:MAG: phosphonate C-P lyase system protein PhnG [Alphaproteobacteria bacterium]|nr:phosphonate C-P lyase system protein PhnG [Alphaproteobacteria bacterium]
MTHIKPEKTNRQNWMVVLAKANWADLALLWDDFGNKPNYKILRPAETGLIMLRARTGAVGAPFNMGETTVTRSSVVSDSQIQGHAYILGRNGLHAEVAAEVDAALQDNNLHQVVMARIINPLKTAASNKKHQAQQKTAATKVDFFTLVRGED